MTVVGDAMNRQDLDAIWALVFVLVTPVLAGLGLGWLLAQVWSALP